MDSQLQEKKDMLSFLSSDIQQAGSDVHRHQNQFQFTPSSPPSPQALGTHLSIPQRQHQSSRTHSQSNTDMLGDLLQMPMQGLESNPSQPISVTSTSPVAMGGAGLAYNPHLLLDHQFRLTQFQQLQQLQQQIFQQQMALISGQVPSILNASSSMETQRHQPFMYNGLPTPAPSGELRPQQQPLDFISPMALNNFVDGRQSHPSSPSLHSGTSSMMGSPAFVGANSVQTESAHSSNGYSSTTYGHPGSISAPEYIAFQTSPHPSLCSSADLDLDISPLTSPWLGAQQTHTMLSFQCQNQNQKQNRSHQQHPHMGGNQHPSVVGPNVKHKRSASPSPSESDARKKQSPAVRPTHPSAFAQQLDQQQQIRRSHRTGSRSTTSTPLLRARSGSTRQRKGSIASALNASAAINEVPGDSPSPVDLSMPPPAPPTPSNSVAVPPGANSNPHSPAMGPIQQNNGSSHMTPVTPASIMNLDMKGKRLKVVTDSSNSGVSTSPASHRSKRNVQGISGGTSLISTSLKPILPGPSCNSAPLLPISTSAISGGHSSAMSASPSSIPHPQVRKTSHKAAEQKRRDSLKTTFDELRVLLPPIPLPSTSAHSGSTGDGEEGAATGSAGTGGGSAGNIFGNAVKPLLPGALPPRGPPKAGGEGPNKSVSKLQLLICGNEYIKTLKSRVERRDEEIARLRQEVKKLRQFMGVTGEKDVHGSVSGGGDDDSAGDPFMMGMAGLMEQLDLDLDLDRDIDEVENVPTTGGKDDTLSSARSDLAIDEDEDED